MTTRKELAGQADRLLAAAFKASIEVLENPKAPPTAKSSSTASAIRIYELLKPGAANDKPASEMTYDELQETIVRLRIEQANPDSEEPDSPNDSMVKSTAL